jgi:hypothetical protein
VAEGRRKRKERGGTGAGGDGAAASTAAATNGVRNAVEAGAETAPPRPSPRERMEAGYAKAEVRNQAAREALVPLAPGERPAVVTVSAILAALISASILITYAAGVKVNGSHPTLSAALAPTLIMGFLAWGMWGARYWAVVCFQAVLVFLIFAGVYALLVEANSLSGFAVTVALLAVSGTLFWRMVKAMARIQMPERVPPQ